MRNAHRNNLLQQLIKQGDLDQEVTVFYHKINMSFNIILFCNLPEYRKGSILCNNVEVLLSCCFLLSKLAVHSYYKYKLCLWVSTYA